MLFFTLLYMGICFFISKNILEKLVFLFFIKNIIQPIKRGSNIAFLLVFASIPSNVYMEVSSIKIWSTPKAISFGSADGCLICTCNLPWLNYTFIFLVFFGGWVFFSFLFLFYKKKLLVCRVFNLLCKSLPSNMGS